MRPSASSWHSCVASRDVSLLRPFVTRPIRVLHLRDARRERARHVAVQDQKTRDTLRRNDVAIHLAVDLEARHRTQDRRPVVEIERLRRRVRALFEHRGTSRRAGARCCRRARGRCRGAGSGTPRPAASCRPCTPRDRCERNLTHSKNFARVALENRRRRACAANSSQVWFCVSQTSVVSVPRTARAFSRAARRQLHDRRADSPRRSP